MVSIFPWHCQGHKDARLWECGRSDSSRLRRAPTLWEEQLSSLCHDRPWRWGRPWGRWKRGRRKTKESERIDLRSPCHTFTCGTLLCETHFCDVTHLTSHSALWEHPMLLCAFGNVYTWLTSFSSWVKLSAQGGRQTCHVGISLGILSPWPSPSALRLGACVGGEGYDTLDDILSHSEFLLDPP